jgi:adenylate kinase
MKPVIYLTGAPATGKSTLARNLQAACAELKVFSYSEQLRKHVADRTGREELAAEAIRQQSSFVVTPQDIEDLDRKLAEFVRQHRSTCPVLIDSHAVTKEPYGFRVTSFKAESLQAIAPDCIVCLYANSDVLIDRIGANAMGRPQVTRFEADMHVQLQAGLAVHYGVILGKAVYLVDSATDEMELVRIVATRAKLAM